jgi:hypothetical protein
VTTVRVESYLLRDPLTDEITLVYTSDNPIAKGLVKLDHSVFDLWTVIAAGSS